MKKTHATLRFLASSALSLLGNSVAGVALPLILLATTGDALAAGTLALICSVPQLIIGVAGGAILDRVNRRNVSIVSDVISAASIALLPVVDMIWGLNFWWFVALGLLGSIGDIPGMTARDAMYPAVTEYDGVDMQRFLGFSQSIESMVTIAGPALAAMLISFIGNVEALWFTAAMSFSAALVTCTIPGKVGKVAHAEHLSAREGAGLVRQSLHALRTGMHVLFRSDGVLCASVSLSLGIVIILGSFQGLVLPVFFTETGEPALLGFTLSAMSAGMLAGSLVYSALTHKVSRRTWYVASFIGMGAGVAVVGLFPPYPIMLAGALLLGFSAGPASALLGFFMLDRVPDASRGSAFGTQNSITMVAAPVAVFATSTLVSGLGTANAALVLIAGWIVLTVAALTIRPMRKLDDEPAATSQAAQPAAEIGA